MNTKDTQKLQARNLYFQQNIPQTQIAETIGVERKTLHRWVTEGRWQEMKHAAQQMPGMILQDLYNQLSCLHARIHSPKRERQYPTDEESIIQRRLMMSIKNAEKQSVGNYMQIFTELINEIAKESETLANLIAPYTDKILQKKLDKKQFRKNSMFFTDEPYEEHEEEIPRQSAPIPPEESAKVCGNHLAQKLPNDPPCDISENIITFPTNHFNPPLAENENQKNFFQDDLCLPNKQPFENDMAEQPVYKMAIYNTVSIESNHPNMPPDTREAWLQWCNDPAPFNLKQAMTNLKNNETPPTIEHPMPL